MGSSTPHNYARISEALISSGCLTLDQQAKALGLGRSTAWNIIKNKHKCCRLSAKTIDRILTNLETPPTVRTVVQQYVAERSVSKRKKQNRGKFLLKDRS
jgi:transcriptional regulator with XRE-family HTH domain